MPPKNRFDREMILQAAFALVRSGGVDALTMRAVGKSLGCSSQPVFSHFLGIDELREAVRGEAKKLYASYVQKGLAEFPAFKGVGMQYIAFAREEPRLFEWLFLQRQDILSPVHSLPELDENRDEVLQTIVQFYGLSIQQAESLYGHLSVYTHGIATLLVNGAVDYSEEDVSRMLTEVFVALFRTYKEKREESV